MMLVCLARDVFLGLVDSTREKKDIAYTIEMMMKYIEEVGPSNVVQLYIDNVAVMTRMMTRLVTLYLHMYRQGCTTHILDLLLEDWGKDQKVKDLVKDCRSMVKCIRKY